MKPVLLARIALLAPFCLALLGYAILIAFGSVAQSIFGMLPSILLFFAILQIANAYKNEKLKKWAITFFIVSMIIAVFSNLFFLFLSSDVTSKFGDGSTNEILILMQQLQRENREKYNEMILYVIQNTSFVPFITLLFLIIVLNSYFTRLMYFHLTDATGIKKFKKGAHFIFLALLIIGINVEIFILLSYTLDIKMILPFFIITFLVSSLVSLVLLVMGYIYNIMAFFELTDEQVAQAQKV